MHRNVDIKLGSYILKSSGTFPKIAGSHVFKDAKNSNNAVMTEVVN